MTRVTFKTISNDSSTRLDELKRQYPRDSHFNLEILLLSLSLSSFLVLSLPLQLLLLFSLLVLRQGQIQEFFIEEGGGGGGPNFGS